MATVVVQDHVRKPGPVPRNGLLSALRVIGGSVWLAVRFLGAVVTGRGTIGYANELLELFWRRVFQCGNAALVVEGQEVFAGRTAIVMSNHTSLLDVPTLLGSVPGPVRMVFKESLAKIPVWGWAAVAAGFVPI